MHEETAKASAHIAILKDILHDLQHCHTSIQSSQSQQPSAGSELSTSSSSVPTSLASSAMSFNQSTLPAVDPSSADVAKLIARARHECNVLENPSFLIRKLVVLAGPVKTVEAFENHLQSLVLTTFKVEEVEVRADHAHTHTHGHGHGHHDRVSPYINSQYHTNSKLKVTLDSSHAMTTSESVPILSPVPIPKSLVPGPGAVNYRRPDRKFLVLSAASEKRALDVCVKIRSTVGRCNVDSCTNTAISYDLLCNYDAVLVWVGGNLSFANSTGLATYLSNYVRAGGGVVVCPWALSTDDCGYGLRGEIVDNGMLGTQLGECLSGTRMIWPPNKTPDHYQKLYVKSIAAKTGNNSLLSPSTTPSRPDTATIGRTSLDGFPAINHGGCSLCGGIGTGQSMASKGGAAFASSNSRRIRLKESDDSVADDDVTDEELGASFDDDEYKSEDDDYYDDVVSTHPIMKDVHIIDGGPYSGHHCIAVTDSPECTVECAAMWEDRTPLAITTKSLDGSRYMTAVINLYPVSSDFSSRCWNVNTDFATLLSNALHLVAKK